MLKTNIYSLISVSKSGLAASTTSFSQHTYSPISFTISTNLKNRIDGLSDSEKKKYCIIFTTISEKSRKLKRGFYVNIPRSFWTANVDWRHYFKYLQQMEEWNIIEINNKYSNRDKFSKSFKIIDESVLTEITLQITDKKRYKDKSIINTKAEAFVYKSLQQLGISNKNNRYYNSINAGVFNLHRTPKSNRLYHSVITMPKKYRKDIILKNSPNTPLYEYDVKSCLPVMLLQLCHDEKEKKSYKKLLDKGIYQTIADNLGKKKDEEFKTECNRFFNGKVKNYIYKYFNINYPILTSVIMDKSFNLAAWYQSTESMIITDLVADEVMKEYKIGGNIEDSDEMNDILLYNLYHMCCYGHLFVSTHDGWIGKEDDEKVIFSVVKRYFKNLTGYDVTINKELVSEIDKTSESDEINTISVNDILAEDKINKVLKLYSDFKMVKEQKARESKRAFVTTNYKTYYRLKNRWLSLRNNIKVLIDEIKEDGYTDMVNRIIKEKEIKL